MTAACEGSDITHVLRLIHYRGNVNNTLDAEPQAAEMNAPVLLARLHWDIMLSLFSSSDASWLIRSSAATGS